MGRLTTHVLDTAHGRPAAGLRIVLTDAGGTVLADVVTNGDGRCDGPLLEGEAMAAGRYVLSFHVGDYFRRLGLTLPEPPFLDVVPVAFAVADPAAHYHVPLLAAPYGYSTYRGS